MVTNSVKFFDFLGEQDGSRVKPDHLSKGPCISSGIPTGVVTNSVEFFDVLGEQDGSTDRMAWVAEWGANKNPNEEGTKWGSVIPESSTGLNFGEGNAGNQLSGWLSKLNESTPSGGTWLSCWNKGSFTNETKCEDYLARAWGKGPGGFGGEKSDWDNKSSRWQNSKGCWEKETPAEDSKSPWESSTSSFDKNQSCSLGSRSIWGDPKTCLDNNTVDANNGHGGWSNKKSSESGSFFGWGQSKGGETTNAGGEEGSWTSLIYWSPSNNFCGNEVQTDTSGHKLSGRGSRGGQGGRWGSDGDREGSGGGSDCGGIRGRGVGGRQPSGGRGFGDRAGSESRSF